MANQSCCVKILVGSRGLLWDPGGSVYRLTTATNKRKIYFYTKSYKTIPGKPSDDVCISQLCFKKTI